MPATSSGRRVTAGVRRSTRYRRALTLTAIVGLVIALVAVMRPTLARAAAGTISTIAGTGAGGYSGDGGPATSARLNTPQDAITDAAGNTYIADLFNHRVRKVDTSGVITTFAGNGTSGFSGDGGPANQAQMDLPIGLLFDSSGNLYIADEGSPNRIRKVDPSGVITTFAGNGSGGPSGDGGPATAAGFNPQYMVITSAGFFFTDCNNNNVRKIDATGMISTFASGISCAVGITADPAGNLYVAALSANVVDKIDSSGTVTVVAGNGTGGYSGDGGPATAAAINGPYGLAYSGGLFIAEANTGVVRKVDLGGTITTVAGNGTPGYSGDGGAATAAQLNDPNGLHLDNADLLIADAGNSAIRRVSGLALDLLTLTVSAPTSVAAGQTFGYTYTIANPGTVGGATGVTLTDPLPSGVGFVSATGSQGTCGLSGSTVTCALGSIAAPGLATVTVNVTAPSSSAVVTNTATVTQNEVDPAPADNTASATTFVNGADVSVKATASANPAPAGSLLTYTVTANNAGGAIASGVTVTDTLPQGITVQSVGTTQGSCSQGAGAVTCPLGTLAVGGTATVTIVVVPTGLVPNLKDAATVAATNPDPNPGNNTAALQTTVSGAVGAISTVARFGQPTDAVRDATGNTYFTNLPSHDVMKSDTAGTITIFAGNGSSDFSGDGGPANQAGLDQPFGLLFDSSGNLYIADQGFPNRIRKVDPSGVITTFAGNGSGGPSGDGGPATAAGFNPQYMVITSAGFFFTDCNNNNVRKIDGAGIISTFASGISCPEGITADPAGNLYVAANGSNVVDKIDTSGTVTMVAGNGTAGYSGDGGAATAAAINAPYGVAYSGGLFIAQYGSGSSAVRKVDLAGTITTVAGNGADGDSGDGGAATAAQLNGPTGLHFDKTDLLIAEYRGFVVREVAKLGPDLLSLAAGAPARVASGSQYSYVFTVVNPGTAGGATGVTLSDPLPSGVGFVSATATQGTCALTGTTVTCPLGQIPALTFAQVTVTVTAPAASTAVANTATVTENELDPVPGDNTASATTYVDPADLSVTGTASPNPVVAGQVLSESWSVQNAGPLGATGVQLTEQVQAGVSIQSTSTSQGTCTASGQKVTCQLGLLANGGAATVAVGLVPAANVVSVTDTATVSGNQVDQNPANNTATAQASVVLGVAVQFTNPGNTPIIPGQEVAYPAGITAGADGNLWYGRLFPNFGEYQSQIGRVTTKGVYQPVFTPDQGFVKDMVQGPDGNVWFSEQGFSGDPGGQSVGRITPQGQVTLFPMGCGSTNCGGLSLGVGPDQNIWFVTQSSSAAFGIGRIDIKSGAKTFFPTGAQPVDLIAGPDGNIWFTTASLGRIGRMTPSGVSTLFTVPGASSCGLGAIVTGPDHLLWTTDECNNDLLAFNVTGAQPSVVAQVSTAGQVVDITSGPDAVYFSLFGSGQNIGRATRAGVTYYSTGSSAFVWNLAAGPDGNIWFTDQTPSGAMGIGRIAPPPSGTVTGPVIGKPHAQSTTSSKVPTTPKVPTRSSKRPPSPPPVSGPTQCPDNFVNPSMSATNPAQGTVFNGDVIANDNGAGCILPQVTINGNLHVTAGAFADLSFSTVNGSVIVDTGGQVHINGSHITGSVTGTGGSFITMFNSKVDVNVTSNPSQYGTAMVCGSIVGGNFTDSGATDTTFPSVIGDPTGPIPCAGNKIAGSMSLSGNAEQILVHGNNVAGAIVVMNNPSAAAFDIRNNNASSLSCSGNAVAPTGGGNKGAKSGQCAGL